MLKSFKCVVASMFVALCSVSIAAQTLSFPPDVVFKGSSLVGWRVRGDSAWTMHDGEFVGTPKPGGKGEWLVGEHSYQDVGLHMAFRCNGECKVGILLRAEKQAAGMKGIYVSVDEEGVSLYRVALDASGGFRSQDKLVAASGINRIVPVPAPRSAAQGRSRPPHDSSPEIDLPIPRPSTAFRAGEWNEIETFLDVNGLRTFLNNGSEVGGIADDDAGRYGPVALYVGGSGEVRIKDLALKDLAAKRMAPESVSPHFKVQRISDMYYSWGATAGDFNHDGVLDMVAGPYIYWGPDFIRYQEIYPAVALNPSKDFPAVNCEYSFDFNGDGWPDILTGPPNATLYINPKGESRRWDKYVVVPNIQSEITVLKDVDGDGIPELVYASDGFIRYAKADPSDPTKPWIVHTVSERGYALAHGIGAGDINGDGRVDIVSPYGWWEQPPPGSPKEPWTYHPEAFGRYGRGTVGGAAMGVYDVNGDGLNDVVTGLNAHGFGLAWFEQKKDAAGKISFVRHMISDNYATQNAGGITFSQAHGSTFADVDGDGIPDFIVGKRYWTHLDSYHDPDPYGDPVLYWYRTVRNKQAPGGAEFVPELIHNRSGAGSDIFAADLNQDGAMDIVTSTDRGAFIFWGIPRGAKVQPRGSSNVPPAQVPARTP